MSNSNFRKDSFKEIIFPLLREFLRPTVSFLGLLFLAFILYVFKFLAFEWVLAILVGGIILFRVRRNKSQALESEELAGRIVRSGDPNAEDMSLDDLNHAGVNWPIIAQFNSLETVPTLNPNDVVVENPPRCPRCGTQLEQKLNFWGWWAWRCVGCKFRMKSRDGFNVEAQRALVLARRRLEREDR